MGASLRKPPCDHRKDAFRIGQDFIIPESQNMEAALAKTSVPYRIRRGIHVLAAVGLEYEPCLQAGEIDDIGPDGTLPAEASAIDPTHPHDLP